MTPVVPLSYNSMRRIMTHVAAVHPTTIPVELHTNVRLHNNLPPKQCCTEWDMMKAIFLHPAACVLYELQQNEIAKCT